MSKTTLVSIITPSYNQSDYLEYTIQSVLNQTKDSSEKFEIEYIVVDGGSSDGSVDIIKRYADQLAWWTSEPDNGQADAINKGFKQASGELVAWLNSDDLFLPGAVSSAVSAFKMYPQTGLIFGNAITIDQQGSPLNRLVFGEWDLDDLMAFRIICQPAVFFRRKVLEDAGYLDESYHFMLDHHLWLRMASIASVGYIGAEASPWAAARHHSKAKNVEQAAGFSREILRILEWMRNEPELKTRMERNEKWIMGGAYRLSARYLLDGRSPIEAIKSYWKSFLFSPRFALQHWHRMVYAVLSLVGAERFSEMYFRMKRRKKLSLQGISYLDDWPGLVID